MKNLAELTFTVQIFKEGNVYVSYNPEIDVSSCGETVEQAKNNLKDALRGFLKSAYKMGTMEEILSEAGYIHKKQKWFDPQLLVLDRFSLKV